MTNHKPATPLPWKVAAVGDLRIIHGGNPHARIATWRGKVVNADPAYIAHAANAYPRLVAALRDLVKAEEEYGDQDNAAVNEAWAPAQALLRELGEE